MIVGLGSTVEDITTDFYNADYAAIPTDIIYGLGHNDAAAWILTITAGWLALKFLTKTKQTVSSIKSPTTYLKERKKRKVRAKIKKLEESI